MDPIFSSLGDTVHGVVTTISRSLNTLMMALSKAGSCPVILVEGISKQPCGAYCSSDPREFKPLNSNMALLERRLIIASE